jgi:hypothetical protein
LVDYEVISIPVISEWLNHRGHRGHREREERDNNSDVNGFDMMGILEYGIADCAGLGPIRHIGNPKEPALSVGQLVDPE